SFRAQIHHLILVLLFLIGTSGISQNMQTADQSVAMDLNKDEMQWGGCPDFMPSSCNISVLHGDPAAENSDILFKIPANTEIPEHWHNSAERMMMVSGSMSVTYEGEATKILKPGTYAYGPARKAHKAKCLDSGPCVLFIAFEGSVDAFPGKKGK
ncbi:cupin domain-containing protein, partial [Christiangramia aquimixticola]|uniref:cupin domain-containing protein n=1 Tax=Christiangramia aquimixticola TaxID=1697558 RepID=UPI003AA9CE25